MTDKEGLIIQDCAIGDPGVWIHGINSELTNKGIFQNGDDFEEIYAFEHDGLINILFITDAVKLDAEKLEAWRLETHSAFKGYWLSDYLGEKFGIDKTTSRKEAEKPSLRETLAANAQKSKELYGDGAPTQSALQLEETI